MSGHASESRGTFSSVAASRAIAWQYPEDMDGIADREQTERFDDIGNEEPDAAMRGGPADAADVFRTMDAQPGSAMFGRDMKKAYPTSGDRRCSGGVVIHVDHVELSRGGEITRAADRDGV